MKLIQIGLRYKI